MSGAGGETRERVRDAAAMALVAATAFLWAAWWRQDVDTTLLNSDVLYELHRVTRCLADFPSVTTLDTYSRVGSDQHVPWLGPFTLVLAALAKIAGASAEGVRELASTLGLLPPLLGGVTAALTLALARRMGASRPAALVAGLGAALSGDALAVFHHGQVKHHLVVPLGVVIAAIGWQSRSLRAWIAGHALMLLCAPEATSVSTILILVAGGSETVGRAWRAGKALQDAPKFLLAPAAASFAALLATRAIDPAAPAFFASDPSLFSGFDVLWLAAIGGAAALGVSLIERPMTPAKRFQLVLGAGLALGCGMALALVLAGRAGPILDRLMRSNPQQAGAAVSLLRLMEAARESHWGGWATILALGAGFALLWTIVTLRRRAPALEVHAAGLMLVASVLALLELRHARGFSPIIALTLTRAAFLTAGAITRKPPLSAPAGRLVVGLGLALIVVPPFLDHAISIRRSLRATPTWPAGMGALCAWMKAEFPDAGPRDEPPRRAVFGPWRWGHHLDVLGAQPVIVDPFSRDGHPDRASEEIWLAESSQDFITGIESRGARHVVVTNAAVSIVDLLRQAPYEIVTRRPDVQDEPAYLPVLRAHFAFRLDELGGLLDESGRLLPLWISAEAREMALLDEDRLRVSRVPVARLYEIVRGATIEVPAPAGVTVMEVELDIVFADGTRATPRRLVSVGDDGVARLLTALPAPHAGATFTVPGPYRLKLGDRELTATITESQVRAGEKVSDTKKVTDTNPAGPELESDTFLESDTASPAG